jgi:hypothetical protein
MGEEEGKKVGRAVRGLGPMKYHMCPFWGFFIGLRRTKGNRGVF